MIVQNIDFVVILAILLASSKANIRNDVVVRGTTVGPGFYRLEGKLAPKCPPTYPYAFNDGRHCCQSPFKLNDTSVASECDGTQLKYEDIELRCCWRELHILCHDEHRRCVNSKVSATCAPTPTIVSSDNAFSDRNAEKTLTFQQCETDFNYMIASGGFSNFEFVVDLGCEAAITAFKLRNTRNKHFNDRGTKDFTIETSNDSTNWNQAVSGTLPSAFDVDVCQIPIHYYWVQVQARYVRYTLVNFYGSKSVGLNHISWELFKP